MPRKRGRYERQGDIPGVSRHTLLRHWGMPLPGGLFFDVSPRSYCAQAADWCACQGILPGLGQGRFFPGRAVSWEELLLAL